MSALYECDSILTVVVAAVRLGVPSDEAIAEVKYSVCPCRLHRSSK